MGKKVKSDSEFTGLGPLRVWKDGEARSAAMNMAIDEILVRSLEEGDQTPILRFYDWAKPSISIGYFQCWQETIFAEEADLLDWVRRWTGGGKVDHRVDLTYTLVVSREHPFFFLPPAENYRWVHDRVVQALEQIGAAALLSQSGKQFFPRRGESPNCFDSPVPFDVVDEEGGKLAGAAQRRTRQGLLHQGSVVEPVVLEKRQDWERTLAVQLAGEQNSLTDWQPPGEWLEQARVLAREKYGTREWQEKF